MATDPNALIAQIMSQVNVPGISMPQVTNPFTGGGATPPPVTAPVGAPMPAPVPAAGAPAPGAGPGFLPQGGMHGLLQAAQSADPNAWSQFLANPWAQHLQQRFGLTPDVLQGLQSTLAGMNAPHDVRQYFHQNYGHQGGMAGGLPQVGMVPGVPGSMGTNPAAGAPVPGNTGIVPPQSPVVTPGGGGTGAPPQAQQGWRSNPMLPQGMAMGGAFRPDQGRPGFGL